MISIAHVVNPVARAGESLSTAQPITFRTMCMARDFAAGAADVSLFATQLAGTERVPLPPPFQPLPDLDRTVTDLRTFRVPRPLPLLRDILDRLHSAAAQSDYLIYTNVDIALQPHFYRLVAGLAAGGHDAFVVNRRTIPARWCDTADIPLMWAETGDTHPGWDCFVFRRDLYPRFRLGDACIGADWIGRMMIANMAALARHFEVFTDLHATFHIGDDREWRSGRYEDYAAHNRSEVRMVLESLERDSGPFDRATYPGRFLRQLDPETAPASPPKLFAGLILVGGPPRSGTTFMARSLGNHPQVAMAIDNHVHECLGLYDYSRRGGLVARLREGAPADPAALRRELRRHLVRDGALHVAPCGKRAGLESLPPPAATAARSLPDESLERRRLPLDRFRQEGLRLCLKSPEISFVLPQLAALFPQASFVLAVRPLPEIAESMFRLGARVKRFPVYHARWRGENTPPPGVPGEWAGLWRDADDPHRCLLYAAAYLASLAEGVERLGRGRCLVYDHAGLRRRPQETLGAIAHFLRIDPGGLLDAATDVRTEAQTIGDEWRDAWKRLESDTGLEGLPARLAPLMENPS